MAFALLLVSPAACLAQSPKAVTDKPVAPDRNSDAYRNGFSEGCEHATLGNTRNEVRFGKDLNFHDGWIAGYKSCYSHSSLNTNNDPNGPLKGLF